MGRTVQSDGYFLWHSVDREVKIHPPLAWCVSWNETQSNFHFLVDKLIIL